MLSTKSTEEIQRGYQRMMQRVHRLTICMVVWLMISLLAWVPFSNTPTAAVILAAIAGIPEVILLCLIAFWGARCPNCGAFVWLQLKWRPTKSTCPCCGVDWKTGKKASRPTGRQ